MRLAPHLPGRCDRCSHKRLTDPFAVMIRLHRHFGQFHGVVIVTRYQCVRPNRSAGEVGNKNSSADGEKFFIRVIQLSPVGELTSKILLDPQQFQTAKRRRTD